MWKQAAKGKKLNQLSKHRNVNKLLDTKIKKKNLLEMDQKCKFYCGVDGGVAAVRWTETLCQLLLTADSMKQEAQSKMSKVRVQRLIRSCDGCFMKGSACRSHVQSPPSPVIPHPLIVLWQQRWKSGSCVARATPSEICIVKVTEGQLGKSAGSQFGFLTDQTLDLKAKWECNGSHLFATELQTWHQKKIIKITFAQITNSYPQNTNFDSKSFMISG